MKEGSDEKLQMSRGVPRVRERVRVDRVGGWGGGGRRGKKTWKDEGNEEQ